MNKKVSVKDILINNGIIIVLALMVLYVGFTKDNFFTKGNFSDILSF